jgi:hypothetical protein
VYDQEKKNLYSRLKKYDDKGPENLTPKQVTKQSRTEQMLQDIADREKRLADPKYGKKASNTTERLKNVMNNREQIVQEAEQGIKAKNSIMDELKTIKLQKPAPKKTTTKPATKTAQAPVRRK